MTTKEKSLSRMDELINSIKNRILPKVDDLVTGKVIFVGRNEIIIDIDGIITGLIRGHEAYDELGQYNNLAVGDEVIATVLETENERGMMELSIRKAGHKKAWDKLEQMRKEAEAVEVDILDANKGGLIVKLDQIPGFLPVSQLSAKNYPRVIGGNKSKILEKLKALVGSKLKVVIISADEEEGTLVFSEKAVESGQRKMSLDRYKKGDVIRGVVTGVVDFGAFVEFDEGLEGLIHISELGWHRIDHPQDMLKEGQLVRAQIIDIDNDKVSLSLKRLEKDPWGEVKDKFKVGDKVEGKVIKLNEFGAFAEIAPQIQGLARKNKDNQEQSLEVGKGYQFEITNFEPLDHKLGLQLAV